MATTAQCLYCFEVLAASLEKRHALDLKQVEELWAQYNGDPGRDQSNDDEDDDDNDNDNDDMQIDEEEDPESTDDAYEPPHRTLRPRNITKLQAASPASATSSSSTPSTVSAASSQTGFSGTSKSSSKSSFFSFARRSPTKKEEQYPLFVTWDTVGPRGHKSLRGCIGTFEPKELSSGLRSYSLTSAFDDVRFSPISYTELSSLSNSITLLMAFTPCNDVLDWELGTHGIRISFSHHGKRYGATYLPHVATDQGWTKEETVISLMRKAGWNGRTAEWRNIPDMRCVRYQGKRASASYQLWREWRSWVEQYAKPR